MTRMGIAGRTFARWHEWHERRAEKIDDPVARLRYLRKAMAAGDLTAPAAAAAQPAWKKWARPQWVLAAVAFLAVVTWLVRGTGQVQARSTENAPTAGTAVTAKLGKPVVPAEGDIWQVEQRPGYEVYSNGLRIETGSTTRNQPRVELVVEEGGQKVIAGTKDPAGIVFHTTESHIAPFEKGQNIRLQRVGKWLLDFVSANRAYHYVIDRFGRVHRVVAEQDVAWHAGNSIWGGNGKSYMFLNQSFLGVAFESETQRGDRVSDSVTAAQVHAAQTLTAMLRKKFKIEAANCVTHAQVSLNPVHMLIGNHVDWAANFPFAEVGLPDNYLQPIAAIHQFGFSYDDEFIRFTGMRMWKGLSLSEEQVRQEATSQGLTVTRYRSLLQQRYRTISERIAARIASVSRGESSQSPVASNQAIRKGKQP